MPKTQQFILAALGAAFLLPTEAAAQTDNKLAIGLSVTTRIAGSSRADASSDFGLDVRLGHEREEWGWAYSFFGWFDIGLQGQPMVPTERLGKLRVRPIMVGYGYTWIRGRSAITADLLGGFAFNSFHLDAAATAEYERRGAARLDTEATNTFVLKPEVQVWRDLSSKIGLKLSGGYLISRPTVTVTSTLGRDARSVRADTFLITAGVVYSIF
jgi:hypothetical protein